MNAKEAKTEAMRAALAEFRAGRVERIHSSVAIRLGVPIYEITPMPRAGLAFISIPKNASTTVRAMIYAARKGRLPNFNPDRPLKIHQLVTPDPVVFDLSRYRRLTTFAIVREPVRRFVSAFRNRILHHGDGVKRGELAEEFLDINHFALNLEDAVWRSDSVAHHFSPQVMQMGGTPEGVDRIFRIDQLDQVAALMSQGFGRRIEPILTQRGGPKMTDDALSPAARRFLESYYAADYEALADYF